MSKYIWGLALIFFLLAPTDVVARLLIRVFKVPGIMEMWVSDKDGLYTLSKTYPICAMSGTIGPKMREGDRQTPEGFYRLTPKSLNYGSHSINTGYPSMYDRSRGWTGSYIMIHGGCTSAGCLAIGKAIDYVFDTVRTESLKSDVDLQIFPFAMTAENLSRARDLSSPFYLFWLEHLQPKYLDFEKTHKLKE